MEKPIVAILCGGLTAERNISLESGEIVFQHLDRERFEPYKILINDDGWFEAQTGARLDLNTFSFQLKDEQIRPDRVFMAIHGSPGEDGKIQGYLDMQGISYTCCDTVVSSVTFNKTFCKEILRDKVTMARGVVVKPGELSLLNEIRDTYTLPVFVKPNNNGSSYGITKVQDWLKLEPALEEGFHYDHEILVEEGITGTEVTCGVYRHQGEIVVLPLCEVRAGTHDFFNYTAKYTAGESQEIIPAPIPEQDAEAVRNVSSAIYSYLGCRGIVRIDYIIAGGTPHFLEVNTVPGLSAASIVPQMARASGLSLTEFFTRLLDETL
ncbi:MAG: D-alanine--D-alanine ligase [Chitinophagales bacterium]|nr:D-alanine--D-alanine ligase [Chitinophagales bacterium]HAE14628.1 D-alanine--D-alanine ligase [Bacteroidota bacterium]MCB9020128.1 D-alanine--D-alanine ligase [Chitinophagales bacterium]MCB9021774.1 D-alanine--D-alanine ligase [Chitinophagales bacterium]MCB9030975.1 D-alanine--D-alanine ligase [Chitinophagales bacterium]